MSQGADVRIAIVGAGLMGRWHADAAARAGGRLVGVCDPNREAAQKLAAGTSGASVETDLHALLANASPEVVHICTPLASHAELCEQAMLAGADVVVEKPVADSAVATERLLAIAHEHQRVLCPVHQLVFQPWLESFGRLGEILAIDYNTCSAGADGRSLDQADGIANDILPHPLSLFEHLLARACPAGQAPDLGGLPWQAERAGSGELHAQASTGSVALSIGISMRGRPPRHELRLTGTRGTLHADLFHGFGWLEGETTSRAYKIARPFWGAGRQATGAASNLIRRAVRVEPAYPGLRKLLGALYTARKGNPGASASPLSPDHTLAVARARDAIMAAS